MGGGVSESYFTALFTTELLRVGLDSMVAEPLRQARCLQDLHSLAFATTLKTVELSELVYSKYLITLLNTLDW